MGDYNLIMNPLTPAPGQQRRRPPLLCLVCFFFFCVLGLMAERADAHPDVYEALPPDTKVIQHGLGDLVGDSAKELAVLFTSGGEARIAVFRARNGRWALLIEGPVPRLDLETGTPRCLETADTNLDGRDEILTYFISPGGSSMITRVVTLENAGGDFPSFQVLLEDLTSPPGYPLFGTENGMPSVTFLKMPQENGEPGYRRVYCWKEDRFQRCVEKIWERP